MTISAFLDDEVYVGVGCGCFVERCRVQSINDSTPPDTTLAIANSCRPLLLARRDSRGRCLPNNPESPHPLSSMSMVTSIYLLPSVRTFRSPVLVALARVLSIDCSPVSPTTGTDFSPCPPSTRTTYIGRPNPKQLPMSSLEQAGLSSTRYPWWL